MLPVWLELSDCAHGARDRVVHSGARAPDLRKITKIAMAMEKSALAMATPERPNIAATIEMMRRFKRPLQYCRPIYVVRSGHAKTNGAPEAPRLGCEPPSRSRATQSASCEAWLLKLRPATVWRLHRAPASRPRPASCGYSPARGRIWRRHGIAAFRD